MNVEHKIYRRFIVGTINNYDVIADFKIYIVIG